MESKHRDSQLEPRLRTFSFNHFLYKPPKNLLQSDDIFIFTKFLFIESVRMPPTPHATRQHHLASRRSISIWHWQQNRFPEKIFVSKKRQCSPPPSSIKCTQTDSGFLAPHLTPLASLSNSILGGWNSSFKRNEVYTRVGPKNSSSLCCSSCLSINICRGFSFGTYLLCHCLD